VRSRTLCKINVLVVIVQAFYPKKTKPAPWIFFLWKSLTFG
jgi:hypothetical protein